MSAFLDEQALLHASPTGVLYDVNGDNQAVGILIHGDGRTLKTYETQLGIAADTQPYATIFMPCGQARVIESKDQFPKVGLPCSCGKEGHWFIYWTEPSDSAPPSEEPTSVETVSTKEPEPATTDSKPSTSTKK